MTSEDLHLPAIEIYHRQHLRLTTVLLPNLHTLLAQLVAEESRPLALRLLE